MMRTLADCIVLIVEDETILALDLAETLREAGCREVHVAANTAAARLIFHQHSPNVAVLDVNLGHETSFAIADMLTLSRTPFIFVTAQKPETIPAHHRSRPLIRKPCLSEDVVDALRAALEQEQNELPAAASLATEEPEAMESPLVQMSASKPTE